MNAAPHTHNDHSNPADTKVSRVLTGLAIGGLAVSAGVILAPHVLPALGAGTPETYEQTMWVTHSYMAGDTLPLTEAGSGLAGWLNRGIASVPVVGETLAAGGIPNALTSGGITLGGLLLSGEIAKSEKADNGITWSKVVKYGALATSALIALPVLLSGITMGLTYLAMLTGNNEFIDRAVGFLNHTLGVSGGEMKGSFLRLGGLAASVPHLVGCGMSVLPVGIGLYTMRSKAAQDAAGGAERYSDGSIEAHLETDHPLKAGVPAAAVLRLSHKDTGQPVTAEELAVTHTEKLHLLVTDSSLKDYQHVHPQPIAPGMFAFTFTPKTANNYSAWADFTLQESGRSHQLKSDFPSRSKRSIPPSIRANNQASCDGLNFEWHTDEPLQQGRPSLVEVRVTDGQGREVKDLQPVMGAYAHLAGFSADGQSIIHAHPLGDEPKSESERGGPVLRFHVEPDSAGPAQFYLQLRRGDEDLFVPFGQIVRPPELASERVATLRQPPHAHPAL